MRIERFAFGTIRIDNETYDRDVVGPDGDGIMFQVTTSLAVDPPRRVELGGSLGNTKEAW